MNLREKLRSCVEAHYPILYLVTFEDDKYDQLIWDLADGRKILEWNMALGCVDFQNKARLTKYLDLPTALDNWLDQELNNHFLVIRNAHLALPENPVAVARLKTMVRKIVRDDDTTATIFLVSSQPYVPPDLEMFITVFEPASPDEKEIKQIIDQHAEAYGYKVDDGVANKLTVACRGLSEYEITRLLNRGYQRDGAVDVDDIALVIEEKKQIVKKSGILEMVSLDEKLDEVGGLANLKKWLKLKAKLMSDLADAQKFGVETPKGAMIVGMPGCGKSLTAKATSALFSLPLLRLDIGALMGRYVGDSEANMRRALKLAETVSPCVLWVDELEKAFTGIGGGSAGSEITSRLFGYFLTWMQEKTKPVFVLATANDLSALPPELLRKGRFDEIFYVDFPDEAERAEILKVHLKKRDKMGNQIDSDQLAQETDGFSGADLEGVVKDAIEKAFVDGKKDLTTDRLLAAIKRNEKHAKMMKGKAKELRKKFSDMGIKSASGQE